MKRAPPGEEPPWTAMLAPLGLLWLAGAALRLTVLALPPVLEPLTSAFRLKPTDVGVLTATPAFFFAAAALPGALLTRRIGALPCLVTGLAVTALGAAARGIAGSTLALELATAGMSLGVALAQPAMPALVRSWSPCRIGLASATYTFGILAGEILPVLFPVTAPARILGDGWRTQLIVWAAPVAITAVVVALFRPRGTAGAADPDYAPWPDWANPGVWKVGLLMGAVGATYFGLNGFIPGWLSHAGRSGEVGLTLTVLNTAQLPAALLMMALAERLAFHPPTYVVVGAAILAGSLLLATGFGHLELAAAAVAGFSLAALLALVTTLQPMVASERELPALSAGTFAIGFGMAVVVALLTGWLERSGAQLLSIAPIAAMCAVVVVLGATVGALRHGRA